VADETRDHPLRSLEGPRLSINRFRESHDGIQEFLHNGLASDIPSHTTGGP